MTVSITCQITATKGVMTFRHDGRNGAYSINTAEISTDDAASAVDALYEWVVDRFADDAAKAIEDARKGAAS